MFVFWVSIAAFFFAKFCTFLINVTLSLNSGVYLNLIITLTAFSPRRSSMTLAEENPDEKNRKRKKKMALMKQRRAKEKTNVKGPEKKSAKRS